MEYAVFTHSSKELGKLRLAHATWLLEFSYSLGTITELAEEEESLGMGEDLEELCNFLCSFFEIMHMNGYKNCIL
jgi:hypothetical protein